jgi:hypothetical protein
MAWHGGISQSASSGNKRQKWRQAASSAAWRLQYHGISGSNAARNRRSEEMKNRRRNIRSWRRHHANIESQKAKAAGYPALKCNFSAGVA